MRVFFGPRLFDGGETEGDVTIGSGAAVGDSLYSEDNSFLRRGVEKELADVVSKFTVGGGLASGEIGSLWDLLA